MKVKVKKLFPEAKLPTYGSDFAAGADLYAAEPETVVIQPGETVLVHTGIALEIPEGYGGFLYARSGLATKKGLAPANKVGVIDSDYRGEVMVALFNQSGEAREVESGERIAQLVIAPFLKAEFYQAEELEETDRGAGGFGSTGRK
jgi:dUTP pyrophosphatase